jgi:hypothetical protein
MILNDDDDADLWEVALAAFLYQRIVVVDSCSSSRRNTQRFEALCHVYVACPLAAVPQ